MPLAKVTGLGQHPGLSSFQPRHLWPQEPRIPSKGGHLEAGVWPGAPLGGVAGWPARLPVHCFCCGPAPHHLVTSSTPGWSAVLVGVGACEQVGGKCAPSVHCPPTLASLSGLPSPTHPQRKVVHQHVHDAAVYNEGNRLVAKRLRKLRHSH